MDKKDFFKGMYEDFFGIRKLERKNEELAREIKELTGNDFLNVDNIPVIEMKSEDINFKDETESELKEKELSKEEKDQYMFELFEKIDNLYITDESKELLKKIIEYMRKYNEKLEKQYIPFDMCIYAKNKETVEKIAEILEDAGTLFTYIKQGEPAKFSLYNIDEIEQLEQLYTPKLNLIIIDGFESFSTQKQRFKEKFSNKLNEHLDKNDNQVLTIINFNNKDLLSETFDINDKAIRRFMDFEIFEIKPDVQDAYQDVLEKVKENMELAEDEEVKLLDYISATYNNNELPYPEYRDNLCQKIIFTKKIPEYEKDKTMDEIFAELNSLVGLEKVKQVLNDLVNLIELKNKSKDDLKIKSMNLHMVFLGNPGTGKTTVARIVAEMLYNLKYIKQNKLIEVSSKDLVAEYVGQTGPKTMAVIQKALGGVLFVDEAYSLASGKGQGNSFNEEAIATLIQAMENYRDELVVIFAGYTKEMQDFLDANSGIVSRIGYTIEFEDYTTEQLLEIFKQMMEKSGFTVTKTAFDRVEEIINEYKDSKNFGNARFVRNIYEKSIIKHASNTKGKKSKKTLKTISKDDISCENLLKM